MGVRERPHNHFTLLQASGADDAEAVAVAAVRRRAVVAIRRPAAARREVPTPAPSHAGRARLNKAIAAKSEL